jgi:hypothetical protein
VSGGSAGGGPGAAAVPEAPPESPWAAGRWIWPATPDRRVLLAAVLLQLVLAALFAHSYDARVFLATGYLVGTGHTPYAAHDLMPVFHHLQFDMLTAIGYPPPWPLALGAIYRATFAVVPDLHLYAFAAKLPVIAANVALAYLIGALLRSMGAAPQAARRAWVALLFNPFVIYVGAEWGQIDAIVALAAVAALVLLVARHPVSSAVLLALAVCVKPTAAPLALAAVLYLWPGSVRRAFSYAAVFVAAAAVFYVLPFLALGWDFTPLRSANAHFVMSGTLSLSSVARVFRDPVTLPGHWWLLGLAWIPALALTAVFVRRVEGVDDLFIKGLAFVLVMFLTRTWLAEPNVVLLLPLVLVPASLGEIDRRFFTALWVIALLYTAANLSPLHMLWLTWPRAMMRALVFMGDYSQLALIGGAVLVVAWQVAGWWLVVTCVHRRPRAVPLPASAGTEEVTT